MGKSLIITEKPSVAREFANVLHVSGRQNGYIEDDKYVITWCVGHLVGLVYPESYDIKYKKWKLEDLPFLPKDYKYDVIESVKSQYEIVHGMLFREDIDRVYWAGDAGKEGQTIEENIRNFGGVRPGMEELRVWIDSQTEEEILRGIREAKPMSAYANLGQSGIMRTIEDYAMGINFSRVMSIKYGNLLNDAAGTKSYTAIAVGRVMTCVLGMVVIREREIRNFVETPFYRVIGQFTDANIEGEWKAVEGSSYHDSFLLYKENGFKEEKDALALIEQLKGQEARVLSVEQTISKKKAPLLFNLAELQAECAKRFKISPDETLQIAQDLYEKKLTTYPRTDARVLSTAIAKEIGKNIGKLRNYEPVGGFANEIMEKQLYCNIAKSSYTDDSKVTDHYAIIPTGQLTELKSLNSLQAAVFELIARRFLAIFYPPAQYQNVKLTIGVAKEQFFASAKALKEPGYLKVYTVSKDNNDAEEESATNPKALLELAGSLKENDVIAVGGYAVKQGKTSPPKRYTSGSMVLAMENAGQLIEDEELREQIKGSGIGTSATRAEIIQKLVRIGYLNLNRKTQVLTPENLGEMVFEVVNMTVPALLNPKMTASWEKGLEGISLGSVDFADYRVKIEEYIRKETLAMLEQNLRSELAGRISDFAGKDARGIGARKKIEAFCPVCKGQMVTTPFGYGCSNYKSDKSGCNFSVGEIAGITLSEEQICALLKDGVTETIRGFKSKAGKKFDSVLRLKQEEGKTPEIVFDFAEAKPELVPEVVCPDCGGAIKKTSFGYGCVNYNKDDENSCHFAIGKISGKALSVANVTQLLKEQKTETLRGFKSQKGTKFDACLVLAKDENQKTVVKLDFEHVEAKVIKDVKCPICGGEIVTTPFGYGCANYSKDKEDSCKFSIGKMAEKSLTETQVKQLLTDGITETIRGFKAKSGKKFDARVAFSRNEEQKVQGLKFDFANVEPVTLKNVSCPLCKNKIAKTPFGYGCMGYRKDDENSCRFMIGKIAGVTLKDAQVEELLLTKKLGPLSGFIAKTGMMFDASLKLTPEGKVEFDFPEKPKPIESKLPCPRCRKMLMKEQWNYTCECGFKVGHTIASVALSEEAVGELLTTGRTKEKITGFISKAGNAFDAYLKYEENQIRFDFDAPKEENKNE